MRVIIRAAVVVAVLVAALFILNTDLLAPGGESRPQLIAHRGLGQTFHREGLTGETCTAARIEPPAHGYLENTMASFAAAFAAGADIVEMDVQPTSDGSFVVFHDWTLDCRTDGTGVTREHSLAELQALDIGFGYTADGGKTFPFRGQGRGLMPTLDEVLTGFPGKRFLINVKSDDPKEGRLLASRLKSLPAGRRASVMVYGGDRAMAAFQAAMPGVQAFGVGGIKRCLRQYALLGWSGFVPAACRNTLFTLPANYAPYFWGYPHRLAARLAEAGTMLVLLGDYDGSGFSSGVDHAETLRGLPQSFDGAIWTNRIDVIGPLVAREDVAAAALDR